MSLLWGARSRLHQNEILQKKYGFDSIFQNLQALHTFALQKYVLHLHCTLKNEQFSRKVSKTYANVANVANVANHYYVANVVIFCLIVFVKSQLDNLVAFEKCYKTHIFLQRSSPCAFSLCLQGIFCNRCECCAKDEMRQVIRKSEQFRKWGKKAGGLSRRTYQY